VASISCKDFPLLIVIAGPTGSGKSALAIHLAQRFGGEVVNCDSVQIYRHFDIGAAKLPENQRQGILHHLIDVAEPDEVFTAGDFSRAARQLLHQIVSRGKLPIVAGGTGFYLRALISGLAPGPQRDESLRQRLGLREQRRPGSLHKLLRRFDRAAAARIHANDIPKVIRALEICFASGKPATDVFSDGRDALEGFRILKFGLFPDRDELYRKLDSRLDAMFESGLVTEVQCILKMGFPPTCRGFESIGYKQALQVVNGELSPKEALFYAKRDTRRYAKRQMTWFRQEPGIEILRGFGGELAIAHRSTERISELITSFTDT
jgi:tRNA dimethylallyltransferase